MSEQLHPDDFLELPRNVESALGMLILNLMTASHDSGKAFYIDIFPEDPEHPDIYRVDGQVVTPKDGADNG